MAEFGIDKRNKNGLQSQCRDCGQRYYLSKHPSSIPREHHECKVGFKFCKKCKQELPIVEFGKHSSSKDGLQYWCKKCKSNHGHYYNMNSNAKHREYHDCPPGTEFCYRCNKIKDIGEFYKSDRSGRKRKVGYWCKQCVHEDIIIKNPNPKINRRDDISSGLKTCSVCKLKKPLSDFNKNLKKKIGINCRCRECDNRAHREYMNKPLARERKRKYSLEYNRRQYVKEKRNRNKKTPSVRANNIRYKHRRRYRERNTECTLTLKQWEKILKMQNHKCSICNEEFDDDLLPVRDHIVPISSLWCPGLTFGNVQALCVSCNCSKGNKFNLGNAIDNILVNA